MRASIRPAVLGAICGATLGAPLNGRTYYKNVRFYEPVPTRMAPSPALDAWVVWHQVQKSARSFPRSLEQFHQHWRYYRAEAAYGMRNADVGLRPPIAGSFENPLAYGSEAIGRAVYWGLIHHGKPDLACERAFLDASIDHAGEGAYAPAAIARMLACAEPGVTVTELIRAGTAILPKDSKCMEVSPIVLKNAGSRDGTRIIAETLARTIGVTDPEHAALSFGYVLMGLAEGYKDFEKGICVPASCGGATEVNGIAVGAFLGLIHGSAPEDWVDQIGDGYVAGSGFRNVGPPTAIEEFVKAIELDYTEYGATWWLENLAPIEAMDSGEVLEALEESAAVIEGAGGSQDEEGSTAVQAEASSEGKPSPEAEPTQEAELATRSDSGTEETIEIPAEPEYERISIPKPGEEMLALVAATPNESLTEFAGMRISVEYVDPPIAQPASSMRLVLHLQSRESENRIVDPKLEFPANWDNATKMGEFRARPQEVTSFPVVVKPRGSEPIPSTSLKLKIDHHEKTIPIFGAQPWYWVGPFSNFDGEAFTTQFPAEDDITLPRTFNSRDGSPVRWSLEYFPGTIFDLEKIFRGDSGAMLLHVQMRLQPGRYTLMFVSDVGARVKVHDREILSYHDRATPAPRPVAPYIGKFETQDLTRITIKVLRAKEAIRPAVFTIFDEEGKAVMPIGFETL